jgi:hypothetical protein
MMKSNPTTMNAAIYGHSAPLPALDPAVLSPEVRDLVLALRAAGLFTSDSGDGSNWEAGMTCALPYPHVFVLCPPRPESVEAVLAIATKLLLDQPSLIDWPYTIESLDKGDSADEIGVVMISHAGSSAICERVGYIGMVAS